MDKVLLVSFWDCSNIGNRLQSFALNAVLSENFDIEPVNLVYHWRNEKQEKLKSVIKCFLSPFFSRYQVGRRLFMKERLLEKWSKIHIPNQFDIGSRYKGTEKIDFREYRAAVTGSDQVWHNFHRQERELDFYYLSFVPKEKRVSFAPSFGWETLPAEDMGKHKRGILDIRFLSCREESGCRIIHELTGREASLLPDPTLCLSADSWRHMEEPVKSLTEGSYIVKYRLGSKDPEADRRLREICAAKNLKVVDLQSMDNDYSLVNPGQFLWLIDHAEYVYTNSFHATVFSIIFCTPFNVVKRTDGTQMFNRIETLLKRFGFNDRVIGESNFDICGSSVQKETVDRELACCREEAVMYLESVFNEL